MKHLHKLYTKEDTPWVQPVWNTHYATGQIPYATTENGSFWLRDVMKFCDHFRGILSCCGSKGYCGSMG
jgi:hypothetical protein